MCGTVPFSLSDHFLVYGCRKKKKLKHPKKSIRARFYVNFNQAAFINHVNSADSGLVYQKLDPNEAWICFCDMFIDIMDIYLPWKNMSFNTDSPPWISREFISSIKERDHLDCYAKRVQTLQAITDAHRARNHVTNLKKNLQRSYFQEAIREANDNSKKTMESY